MIGVVCLFSVGYAAFSSNFLVSGKGIIVEKPITIDELKETKVTGNDGLYEDIYEENKYIYRGSNPDNYIFFNNELRRIMSIENGNNLKIIRNESIDAQSWDAIDTRNVTTSNYCSDANKYGCNAWAATNNLVNAPNEFILYNPNGNPNIDSVKYTGTVTTNSSLNTYLNTEYYNNLNEKEKNSIIDYNFNVGTPGNYNSTEDLATDINQEALYKWRGKVGLMNITEIIRTTTNDKCTNLKSGYDSDSIGNCNINNWLWTKVTNEWTLSPSVNEHRDHVWYVRSEGYISYLSARYSILVRPVVHLKSEIKLSGKGTENKPYIIVS